MTTQINPMLAMSAPPNPRLFERDGMSWEPKWDGYRLIVELRKARPALLWARSGKPLDLPHLAEQLSGHDVDAILDGEVIVNGADGRPSFNAMQLRLGMSKERALGTMRYMVFDVLRVNEVPVTDEPYVTRRHMLGRVVELIGSPMVQLTPATDNGVALWHAMELANMEGMIGKPVGSKYLPGERGTWIKVKRTIISDFIVVGWIKGIGKRAGEIGSLVLAEEAAGHLTFAGLVGTGFNWKNLETTMAALVPNGRDDCPLADAASARRSLGAVEVLWVNPTHKATVEYSEQMKGALRFPSFQKMEAI